MTSGKGRVVSTCQTKKKNKKQKRHKVVNVENKTPGLMSLRLFATWNVQPIRVVVKYSTDMK